MKALFVTPEKIYTDKGLYEFSKNVSFEKSCKGTVRLFAACRYILYINGKYICEGPCRSAEDVRFYETVEVDFAKGENEIVVRVMHLTVAREFSSCFKSQKPMLVFQASTEYGIINSDIDWKCEYLQNHLLVDVKSFQLYIEMIPPFEHVIGARKTQELPIVQCGFFDFDGIERSGFGLETPLYMEPRPIPLILPQAPVDLKVIKKGEGYLELDAEEYMTAKVEFALKAGHTYKILYSECYQFGNEKRMRDDTSGTLVGPYDVVKAEEDMIFSPFWYRAFRFVRIECDNPEENVLQAKAYRVNYPFDITGSFHCSDETYNKMWDVSINTLKCCTHEMFMDCPFYEQQQYVMDSAIECAALMRLTQDVEMVRKCLSEFAASQQPTGLLRANYPCCYVQIIPGFSFFFVYLLRDYLEYSADLKFAARYTGVMDKILNFFDAQVREKGYIADSRFWDYQDWVEGWERGTAPVKKGEAITLYNLYYACALKDAAFICRKVGRVGLAEDYEKRYAEIKDTINRLCYNEEKGMYRDGTNSDSYSVHTSIWAVLSEVAPKEAYKKMAENLFDMQIARATFSMNFYLFRAIEKCNVYRQAFGVIDGWKVMLDSHCTTWCEKPGNPRSECHGWSCAPVHEFSANVLGVKYSLENEINIVPQIGHLTFAKGRVPTRFGFVDVNWTSKDGRFHISVNSPDGVCKNITLPNGKKYTFMEQSAEFTCEL